jgi:hypothetical protein
MTATQELVVPRSIPMMSDEADANRRTGAMRERLRIMLNLGTWETITELQQNNIVPE